MPDKKNYVLIIIAADGQVAKLIQTTDPPLEQLQAIVDGPIQQIPYFSQIAVKIDGKVHGYNRGRCYGNEEGRMRDMPMNPTATSLWKDQYAYVDHWLVGNIVFVARTTEG